MSGHFLSFGKSLCVFHLSKLSRFPSSRNIPFVIENMNVDRSNYQSLSIGDPEALPILVKADIGENGAAKKVNLLHARAIYVVTFVLVFAFYGYCVFHTFAPYHVTLLENTRRLQENAEATGCTLKGTTEAVTIGTVGGAILVLGAFAVVGLTPLGPIAGGIFAANMGAGLTAGSLMAVAQSAAMTSTVYATGAALGAAGSATYACA